MKIENKKSYAPLELQLFEIVAENGYAQSLESGDLGGLENESGW